jgi:class 3 adenylate cyclase
LACPWEAKTRERQADVREAYRQQAEDLRRSQNAADLELAKQVAQFVADMPEVETKRDWLSNELAKAIGKTRPPRVGKSKDR